MQSRNYYLNKLRKRREPADWDAFRELRNVVKKRLRDDKQSYFESLCKEMGAKPKRVWNELNAALGRKINRKQISLDIGSEMIQCPRAIATHLNHYFVSPCLSPLPHIAIKSTFSQLNLQHLPSIRERRSSVSPSRSGHLQSYRS